MDFNFHLLISNSKILSLLYPLPIDLSFYKPIITRFLPLDTHRPSIAVAVAVAVARYPRSTNERPSSPIPYSSTIVHHLSSTSHLHHLPLAACCSSLVACRLLPTPAIRLTSSIIR